MEMSKLGNEREDVIFKLVQLIRSAKTTLPSVLISPFRNRPCHSPFRSCQTLKSPCQASSSFLTQCGVSSLSLLPTINTNHTPSQLPTYLKQNPTGTPRQHRPSPRLCQHPCTQTQSSYFPWILSTHPQYPRSVELQIRQETAVQHRVRRVCRSDAV
ncbi:uncharacterized protein BDZ99DRAFT_98343 [Mytilinidion resinicola]|uniref:Uncharacterized protein n=1 Tax=Mytilinidion resinicola TaxID=574789 RepID=A0A6A6YDH8_9PEZI|nr:uncharacterized protein BDZ99DRAFT_98343 [Mytilinidion resinicola]KAF2806583.1 hypothetical protein BDZ99DRAFT_98343 [Mytilinidion resinicola]